MGCKETEEEEQKIQSRGRRSGVRMSWNKGSDVRNKKRILKEGLRCVFPSEIIHFSSPNMPKKTEYEDSDCWQQKKFTQLEIAPELL